MSRFVFNIVSLLMAVAAIMITVYMLDRRQYPLPKYFDFRLTDTDQDVCSQDSSFIAYYGNSDDPRRLIFTAEEKRKILNTMLYEHFFALPNTIKNPSGACVEGGGGSWGIAVNYNNHIKKVVVYNHCGDRDEEFRSFLAVRNCIEKILQSKIEYSNVERHPSSIN